MNYIIVPFSYTGNTFEFQTKNLTEAKLFILDNKDKSLSILCIENNQVVKSIVYTRVYPFDKPHEFIEISVE